MTVMEVEARTGLDRGTVRFYESQGLISPAREPNGYRNYSQGDVDKLLKVKLLRSLDFSIDDILAMDADGGDFTDRIRARLKSLQAREADLGDARRVLERMLEDNAQYVTLDTAQYMEILADRPPELPAPERDEAAEPEAGTEKPWEPDDSRWRVEAPAPPPPVPPEPITVGPWERYFARLFDRFLVSLALIYAMENLTRVAVSGNGMINIFMSLLSLVITMAAEPVFIRFLGATPGKLILGIRVTDRDGGRLTWAAARERTTGAVIWGAGLYIFPWSAYRLWKSYKDAQYGWPCRWESGSRLEHRDERIGTRYIAMVLAFAAVFALNYLSMAQARMPQERGDLTPAEYADSYNDYLGFCGYTGWKLLEDGSWAMVSVGRYPDISEREPVRYTLEDGHIAGLEHTHYIADRYLSGPTDMFQLRIMAAVLIGADRDAVRGYRAFSALLEDLGTDTDGGAAALEGFDVTRGPWRAVCTIAPDPSDATGLAYTATLVIRKN